MISWPPRNDIEATRQRHSYVYLVWMRSRWWLNLWVWAWMTQRVWLCSCGYYARSCKIESEDMRYLPWGLYYDNITIYSLENSETCPLVNPSENSYWNCRLILSCQNIQSDLKRYSYYTNQCVREDDASLYINYEIVCAYNQKAESGLALFFWKSKTYVTYWQNCGSVVLRFWAQTVLRIRLLYVIIEITYSLISRYVSRYVQYLPVYPIVSYISRYVKYWYHIGRYVSRYITTLYH